MKNKTNILIWAITILVILNLTIVGTILIKTCNSPANSISKGSVELNENKTHLGKYFKDELDLTNEQHNKFREIRHQYHEDSDRIKRTMQQLRKQFVTELGKENSNKEYIHRIASDIGNQHKELKLLTSQYYLNMKALCNDQQKEKLNEIFQKLLDQNGNMPMPNRKNK